MIDFGPAGSSNEVIEQKMTRMQQSEYLTSLGLSAYEYPFTFGVNMNDATKQDMIEYFKNKGFKLSVHAPYYINFASIEEEKIKNSFSYLLASVKKAKEIGADRVVFHPGSLTKLSREDAIKICIKNLKDFIKILDENNIDDIYICPETMGKHGQIGTWQEVKEMCALDKRIIPCLDFGHINAFTLGELNTEEKYHEILKAFIEDLGKNEIHIHFSKIEFTPKGEKKHLTFSDKENFGPDYKQMLDALKKYDVNFRVISESNGTQCIDSNIMKEYLKK